MDPFVKRAVEVRRTLANAVTHGDVREMVQAQVEKAKEMNASAIRVPFPNWLVSRSVSLKQTAKQRSGFALPSCELEHRSWRSPLAGLCPADGRAMGDPFKS